MTHMRRHSTARLVIASFMLGLVAGAARAQTIGSNKQPDQAPTFTLTVKSQLVVETLVPTDKQGRFVPGLTAKDFTVTEDGAPQVIKFFSHETLPNDAPPLTPLTTDTERVTIYKRLARTSIAPESVGIGGASKYKDHRLMVMYFDMTAMGVEDQQRALLAAEKFVRTQMTEADLVSIMRYQGGSVDVLQDFTADRNHLLSILETMVVGEGQGNVESSDNSASADTGAAFGQDSAEFNIFNTDRQLAALQTASRMLSSMSQKKVLLYFASGLRLNGVDNQAQLRATVNEAIRAGVSFWMIDARGLVASAPLGDATQGNQGNIGMYNGTAAQAVTDQFQQSQDTMYSLASDTGGKAFLDNNDLTRGIVNAQRSISDYYTLGYYTTNTAMNGAFRKIKITSSNPAVAKMEYRQGYYAGKVFAKFNATDKERQLEDALMLGDPITDLTVSMELDYFQLNRAEYFVPFVVKIPGRELALAKKFGAEHTLIDFICEVKDEIGGTTVSNVRDNVNIKLTDETAAQLADRPIEYDGGFTLLPGTYQIKFLARDDETGRIGTYETTLVIPNLNKVLNRVAISSVVLASQRVPLDNAIYNAASGKQQAKNDAANPLVFDGEKLIPSVTRVFSADRDLYVFLQAYRQPPPLPPGTPAPATPPPAPTTPLLAYVSFYKDGKLQRSAQPIAELPLPNTRLNVTPLRFTVPLSGLAAGQYQVQVTVLDAAGGKAAFWQGPMMITNP